MADRCNACGGDLQLTKNNSIMCPHCDGVHTCEKSKKPQCRLLEKWEGSGPKSG